MRTFGFLTTEELFDDATLAKLKNMSEYYLHEMTTPSYGRCYTICKLQNMTLADYQTFTITSKWNYKVYVHQKGEEFWLAGDGVFRPDVPSFLLGKHSLDHFGLHKSFCTSRLLKRWQPIEMVATQRQKSFY